MIFFCDLSTLPLISYFVLKKIFFLSDMIEFEKSLLNFPSFLSKSSQPKKIFCAFCVQINNILKFILTDEGLRDYVCQWGMNRTRDDETKTTTELPRDEYYKRIEVAVMEQWEDA